MISKIDRVIIFLDWVQIKLMNIYIPHDVMVLMLFNLLF
jgi:hypothetical protein